MLSVLKRVLRDSIVYGIANIIQKLTPLIIIPVITTYLNKTAFKVYDIAFMYTYLFCSLVILGLDVAASVFYFDQQREYADKKKILTYSLLLQVAVAVLYFLFFYPFRQNIAGFVFANDREVQQYWQLALLLIPGHILLHYGLSVLMWLQRKKEYLVICFFQTLLITLGVYLTVLVWNGTIRDVFYVFIGATTLCGVCAIGLVRKSIFVNPFPLNTRLIKNLFLFGVPIGFTAFFRQLLPSIDRYFLIKYHFIQQLPEYLLAAKVGGLFSIVSTAFLMAFTPYSLNKINQEDAEAEISKLFHIIYMLAFISVPFILIFKNWLILLFADTSYQSAARLFPFFFFGWIFDLFTHFTMLGIYKSKKSFLILGILLVGNLIISILLTVLIPSLSIYGAAMSFTLTKAILFFGTLVSLKKFFTIIIDYRVFLCFLFLSVLLSLAGYYMNLISYLLIVGLFFVGSGIYIKKAFAVYPVRSLFMK